MPISDDRRRARVDHLVIAITSASARTADPAMPAYRWAPAVDRPIEQVAELVYIGRSLDRGAQCEPIDVPTLPRALDHAGVDWRLYTSGRPLLSGFDADFRRPERFDRFIPLVQLLADALAGGLPTIAFAELLGDDVTWRGLGAALRAGPAWSGTLAVCVFTDGVAQVVTGTSTRA